MDKLYITLETVTPLFLGGAEARGEPEVRPASIRGALRYWLRAALGGVYGDNAHGLERVRTAEASVFGSADEKTTSASVVNIRRVGQSTLKKVPFSKMAQWNEQSRSFGYPGVAYLFFSARRTGQENERDGLVGNFKLGVFQRPGVKNSSEISKLTYLAFWLLTHLGSLGSRGHRGAGIVQTIHVDGDIPPEWPNLIVQSRTPTDLVDEIKTGIDKFRKSFVVPVNPISVHNPSEYDVLYPGVFKIWVADKKYDTWEQAINEIGQTFQRFRNRRPPDYSTVKTSITTPTPLSPSVQRAIFGLPIVFYYRSLQQQFENQGNERRKARQMASGTLESTSFDRRTSPLSFRVVKLSDGKFTVVFTLALSKFLPPTEELRLAKFRGQENGPLPPDNLLWTFLTKADTTTAHSSLKDKGIALLEVSYE